MQGSLTAGEGREEREEKKRQQRNRNKIKDCQQIILGIGLGISEVGEKQWTEKEIEKERVKVNVKNVN